jgi:queuine tRNA-ribosyltransferase
MLDILDHSLEFIDKEKPHYLMGIGEPTDIVESVARGMDCFDSRYPTMNARHGSLMTHEGKILIKNKEFRYDEGPIDKRCSCFVCRDYSRSYMHHMLRFNEGVGLRLASYHNLHFMRQLMKDIRQAIIEQRFDEFRKDFVKRYDSSERGRFSY